MACNTSIISSAGKSTANLHFYRSGHSQTSIPSIFRSRNPYKNPTHASLLIDSTASVGPIMPSQSSRAKCQIQIKDIQQNAQMWYKVRVLLFDLRHFKEKDESRERLELVIDPSYIGASYFEPSEAQLLKQMTTDDSGKTLETMIQATLDEKSNRRKRLESSDYRVCAPHDLAPIFERFFGIKPKDLVRDK